MNINQLATRLGMLHSHGLLRQSSCLCASKCILRSLTSSLPQWDLLSAVCIERKPVISKEMNQIERDYDELCRTLEIEQSLLSDHEIKALNDEKKMDRMKSNEMMDSDIEAATLQTAQEFEDASLEDLKRFTPASRTSRADIENDCTSTERKLDQYLILCLRQKIGSADKWLFPQAVRQDGETMRQVADRLTKELCGSEFSVQIVGNAPIGYYKYKYPKSVQASRSSIGAKVFFFKGKYKTGSISLDKDHFRWWTQQEMLDNLPNDYMKCVKTFLIDDTALVNQTNDRSP